VVGAFLMGGAVLVLAGCAGVRSEAPEEGQAHTEATASEEARCEGTRTYKEKFMGVMTTNDLPGCPKGGLLSGTNENDGRPADRSPALYGKDGDDEIHGLGGVDAIMGGGGNDVIYGGPGDDSPLSGDEGDDVIYGGDGDEGDLGGGPGEDVLYGGEGNDFLDGYDVGGQRDKLYCGEGRDYYLADKNDYVDSSCEEKAKVKIFVSRRSLARSSVLL
jgi:hypothetical protein